MMTLRLVRCPDGAEPGRGARRIAAGGSTIGRAPECDLVLDDPLRLVSRRHAWLAPRGEDAALLRCISTRAALMVNGQSLPPGGERVVHGGDRLRIGVFEVLVEAHAQKPVARGNAMPAASPAPPKLVVVPAAARPSLSQPPVLTGRSRLDRWFDLDAVADPLGPGSPLPAADGAILNELIGVPSGCALQYSPRDPEGPLRGPWRPGELMRKVAARPATVPSWKPSLSSPASDTSARRPAQSAPAKALAPVPCEAAAPDGQDAKDTKDTPKARPGAEAQPGAARRDALRAAFLRGAGLSATTPVVLNPVLMEHLGALLRTATEGTLGLLRSRALAKRSIRAEGTGIVARENNPLKFSPDAAHALTIMLNVESRPGFLAPVEALRDACDDLQVHQLAMVAGMRAAVFDLISRLGPEAAGATKTPPQGLARYVPALRDAALWRQHSQCHARMLENLDDAIESTFGREFVLAYEAQAKLAAAAAAKRSERSDHGAAS